MARFLVYTSPARGADVSGRSGVSAAPNPTRRRAFSAIECCRRNRGKEPWTLSKDWASFGIRLSAEPE